MNKLNTCDLRLVALFKEVIKGYDCTVLDGMRDKARQNRLFKEGKSKVKYPNSRHNMNPSCAVDVAPYPIDWDAEESFYHFAGYVQGIADAMGIKIRWGGDWDEDNDLYDQSFNDLVHFELQDTSQ